MKPYQVNFWNAMILLIVGLWGHYASDFESFTTLIAPLAGFVFFLATPGFKRENQKTIHVVVLLTFLVTLFLFVPLMRQSDGMSLLRVSIMLISGLFTSIFFFQSFLDARAARKSES